MITDISIIIYLFVIFWWMIIDSEEYLISIQGQVNLKGDGIGGGGQEGGFIQNSIFSKGRRGGRGLFCRTTSFTRANV